MQEYAYFYSFIQSGAEIKNNHFFFSVFKKEVAFVSRFQMRRLEPNFGRDRPEKMLVGQRINCNSN